MNTPKGEGGRTGLIAVLTLWTRYAMWTGILKGIGVMLPTMKDQLNTQVWILGWMASLISVIAGISGVFAGFLGRRFGFGRCIMVCGVLISVASISAVFATSVLHLACSYILLSGISLGVSGVLAKEAVGRCFHKNYATATGIAQTGYNVGLIVFAPLVQLFLDTYGWRGAMLLMGGIFMHFTVCGALLMTAQISPSNNYLEISSSNAKQSLESEKQTNMFSRCGALLRGTCKNFDTALLANVCYWSMAIMICSTKFTLSMWAIYFVSLAQTNGFTTAEAATMVTLAGVASLISKLTQGFVFDRGILPVWCVLGIAVCITSASYCSMPWLTSYWLLMVVSCLTLIGEGVISCLNEVTTKQLLGVDLLAGAYGWIGIKQALLSLSLGFFPGWIYDYTGSYTIAFIGIGALQFLPMFPLLLMRYYKYIN